MNQTRQSGFTLIELLVVIAIIGILASVVMVSVASARNKAKNAAVQQSFKTFEKLLAQEYNDNGSYANLQNVNEVSPVMTFSNDPFFGPPCSEGFSASEYVQEARQICQKIVDNVDYFMVGYLRKYYEEPYQRYSLSTTLNAPPVDFVGNPYEYCLGPNGSYYGSPIGNGNQTQPGCYNSAP